MKAKEFTGRTIYVLRTASQRARSVHHAMQASNQNQSSTDGGWGGRIWYLMASIGCVLGIGNFWRLPWQCFKVKLLTLILIQL